MYPTDRRRSAGYSPHSRRAQTPIKSGQRPPHRPAALYDRVPQVCDGSLDEHIIELLRDKRALTESVTSVSDQIFLRGLGVIAARDDEWASTRA